MTGLTVKLLETNAAIEAKIKSHIAVKLNSRLSYIKRELERRALKEVPKWIQTQPEILSLTGGTFQGFAGSLAAHFGLPAGTGHAAVMSIVGSVAAATTVVVKPFSSSLMGSIYLNFQPNDFKNLLNLPEGFVRAYPEGHWLNSLLMMGMSTIVTGYRFKAGVGGRSGGGIMTPGSSWRVPPQHAGTAGNNFVTRAFSGRENEITDMFSQVLAKL